MQWQYRGQLLVHLLSQVRQQGQQISLLDGYNLRYSRAVGPSAQELLWAEERRALSAAQSMRYELDLLPRQILGRWIYVGFSRVKLIWVLNRPESVGRLMVGPAEEDGWNGPWSSSAGFVLPPGGALLVSHWEVGWPVGSEGVAIQLSAAEGPVVFDLAVLGIRVDSPPLPEGEESGSGESSSSEVGSSSAESSAEQSSGEESSESSSSEEWDSSSYEDSGWS